MNLLKKSRSILTLVVILVFTSVQLFSGSVSAQLSAAQITALQEGAIYFNTDACGSSTTDNISTSIGSSNASATPVGPYQWSSTAGPPYYLEEYIINILQDLAQYKGIPTSDTVTQEHVVALVAWAWVEGGNIANTGSAFNVWNMGFLSSYPQLYAGGTGQSDGAQTAFASFNAGVEAYTIEFNSSYQSRIGSVLADPTSSAQQVLQTVADYNQTPGNLAWAWGPTPDNPASVLQFNLTTYTNSLLAMLKIVSDDYSKYAAVEIGPGIEGNASVPASSLTYTGSGISVSGTSSDDSGSLGCATSASNGNNTSCNLSNGSPATGPNVAILCEALQYNGIYYKHGGGHGYTAFRQACPEASISSAAASSTAAIPGPCATDCSGLVSVAVDGAYDQTYAWSISDSNGQMTGSDSQDWQSIPISEAQAGDIVTSNDGAGSAAPGSDGHVEIVEYVQGNTVYTFGSHYTGSQTSAISSPASDWNEGAWRWTGPGSSTS